jgi:hypothetical protein
MWCDERVRAGSICSGFLQLTLQPTHITVVRIPGEDRDGMRGFLLQCPLAALERRISGQPGRPRSEDRPHKQVRAGYGSRFVRVLPQG